jgi:uncharacterized protein
MENKMYLNKQDIQTLLANVPKISFEVTDRCNLQCEYCGYGELYRDYDKREGKFFPAKNALNFLKYMSVLWNSPLRKSINDIVYIDFYGGEPLLNVKFIRHIIEYLEYESDSLANFTYTMTTNALLLDKYIDYLVDKKFKLYISMDGDEYNSSYRINKKRLPVFNRILCNIELVKAKYPIFFENNVNFLAVLHNRNSVESIYRFFKKYNKIPFINDLNSVKVREDMKDKFSEMYKNSRESLQQSEHYSEIEADMFLKSPTYHSVALFLQQYSEYAYKDYNELLYGKPKIEAYLPTGTCLPFSKKVFITVNGKILPCERIGQQFYLGNLTNNGVELDFDAIAQKYNQYYAKMEKQCTSCYNKQACIQCIYNMPDIEKEEPKCLGCMSRGSFENYRNAQLRFLAKNPEAYYKIMNPVMLQ